jgi:beta-glucosidase
MDMFMAPDSWKRLYDNTLAQVRSGRIPMARAGRGRAPHPAGQGQGRPVRADKRYAVAGELDRLGAPDHLAVAREAVRKSLVLLKNEGSVLPIRLGAKVLVAGVAADDIGTGLRRLDPDLAGHGQQQRRLPQRPVDLGWHR